MKALSVYAHFPKDKAIVGYPSFLAMCKDTGVSRSENNQKVVRDGGILRDSLG